MKSQYVKVPLYCQLASLIEEKIANGEWKVGSAIPSERELSTSYKMSRITVRNAVDELVKQGKLEKVQGKGTFVVGTSIIQNLGNVYSFSREMEKQGKISSTKLLTMEIVEPTLKVAEQLGIEDHQKVIHIKRLRCADDELPIMVEETYFEYQRFSFLLTIDFDKQSLYKTLEQDFGIYINKAIETFKACELREDECNYLQCPPKQYGLLVRRTSYADDRIVCYSSIVSKGDIYEFTIKLTS